MSALATPVTSDAADGDRRERSRHGRDVPGSFEGSQVIDGIASGSTAQADITRELSFARRRTHAEA